MNKIDMGDMYFRLNGLVSLMQLFMESLEDDVTSASCDHDERNLMARALAIRCKDTYLPAFDSIFIALRELRDDADKASK